MDSIINNSDLKAKKIDVSKFYKIVKSTIDYSDIIGLEEAKKEFLISLKTLSLSFLRGNISRKGNGYFVFGVPGVGKSMFIDASVNEINKFLNKELPYLKISLDKIVGTKVNETSDNMKALYDYISSLDGAIIYFEEIDYFFLNDQLDFGKMELIVSFINYVRHLLNKENIYIFVSTCLPDKIDQNIVSIFNNYINITLPTEKDIFTILSKEKHFDSSIDLHLLSKNLLGYSRRDIKLFFDKLNDELFEEFMTESKVKSTKDFNEYKITNKLLTKVLKEVSSTVKK